ncbi:MAG: hypothetical protein OXF95_00690 [Rhodobacteraceae bacterium]|nr:hypothetical protein [Paracoccaceae bacterium]
MENLEQNSQDSFSSITNNFGTLSSMLFAGSVFFSLIYDWIFFFILGISFIDAPTTLTDHLETWLILFPHVVVNFLWFFFVFLVFIRREEKIRKKLIERQGATHLSKIRNLEYHELRLYILFSLPVPIYIFIFQYLFQLSNNSGSLFLNIIFFCFVVFIIFLFYFYIFTYLRNLWLLQNLRLRKIIFVLAATSLFSLCFASSKAITRYQGGVVTHSLQYSSQLEDAKSTSEDVILLRSFNKWLLVKDLDERVRWIDLERIVEIESLQKNWLTMIFVDKNDP